MKLVVGLGNPGAPYQGTRHNVGFEVLDTLIDRHVPRGWDASPAEAIEARWRRIDGDPVLFAKPLTFMNLSGRAVQSLCHFYRIDVADMLVVCDDVNLPLGRLRARASGTEGGHNGLRSIAQSLGTIAYSRLRVGVGRGETRRDLADHVLTRFDADERATVRETIGRAADAVDTWISSGMSTMMNTFNRVEREESKEESSKEEGKGK